ncbi:GNAT family N-acetyltransferase [Streptomyces sp. HSW2009]|uniref:GNAT family N-acetyltransferase n=1 Tax=Streptomyces sp. HSW2009 TaxID=3142890 RepID=UPI0032F0083C
MTVDALRIEQISSAAAVGPALRQELLACWIAVTNAGGAAGFPFPPVDSQQVAPVLDALVRTLAPDTSRLVTAHLGPRLVGWLHLRRDLSPLVAHWGTVHHVQTHPGVQGRGIGTALMHEAHRSARDGMGLEQLHLAARGGAGLETFYARLGWREVGRGPAALRLGPGADRDEILLFRRL